MFTISAGTFAAYAASSAALTIRVNFSREPLKGTTCVVLRAEDNATVVRVSAISSEAGNRLRDECAIARQLSHPGIVRIIAAHVLAGNPSVTTAVTVMEACLVCQCACKCVCC
jgi:hypothetical protein